MRADQIEVRQPYPQTPPWTAVLDRPSPPSVDLTFALQKFEQGHLADAEAACRRVLERRHDDRDALHLLGCILRRGGRPDMAIAILRKALDAAPQAAALRASLADALLDHGAPDEAVTQYREALVADPEDRGILVGLAIALQAVSAYDEALSTLDRALDAAPMDRAVNFHRVNCLHALGRTEDARAAYARLRSADASYRRAHALWAERLVRRGRVSEARAVLAIGLDLEPDQPELAFGLAALGGSSRPERAPDAYIVQHFDAFADTFDDTLMHRLGYRVPRLLLEEVRRAWGPPRRALDVLDLGCGTGLCGVEVRPYARRLVGIDLSPQMLERARARGIYDELRQEELTSALADQDQGFDAVVAADVLIYFGDLQPIVSGVARALRPGGLFICSIERLDEGDVALHAGGRYAHSARYLREVARSENFGEVQLRECNLRLERGNLVPGYVAVFRRVVGA